MLNAVKVVPGGVPHLLRHRQPGGGDRRRAEQGRGILGVIDGESRGVETEADISVRRRLLRELGYKL